MDLHGLFCYDIDFGLGLFLDGCQLQRPSYCFDLVSVAAPVSFHFANDSWNVSFYNYRGRRIPNLHIHMALTVDTIYPLDELRYHHNHNH